MGSPYRSILMNIKERQQIEIVGLNLDDIIFINFGTSKMVSSKN